MRFVVGGPDIPNKLITQWREGNVVFVAGAGVSVPEPSNLPLFQGLVKCVYKALNDPLGPALKEAEITKTPEGRNNVLREKVLSARQLVEANLYFKGEF